MSKPDPDVHRRQVFSGGVENPSLSKTARTGEQTEDALLLNRGRKRVRPQPRNPALGAFTHDDPWRVLRITSEFVHGFNMLAEIDSAITIFGSARTSREHPMYAAAQELGGLLAKAGFA